MFHFFNYNLCSRTQHTPSTKTTTRKPENLLLNISEIVFMSLFSNVVRFYWNRKSLFCCCRLGTFSWEKSCLIIFRHKYECILACEQASERRPNGEEMRQKRYGMGKLYRCILAFLLVASARWDDEQWKPRKKMLHRSADQQRRLWFYHSSRQLYSKNHKLVLGISGNLNFIIRNFIGLMSSETKCSEHKNEQHKTYAYGVFTKKIFSLRYVVVLCSMFLLHVNIR